MSILAAVLVLGQVANNGSFQVPTNLSEEPAQVQFDPSEPASAPLRPQSDQLGRPAARAAIGDANAIESVSPAASVQPLREQAAQTPTTNPTSQPTTAAPVASSTPAISAALQVAAAMAEEILVLDEQSQQLVRRVRLVDALSRVGDPSSQSVAIHAYWNLAECIANVRYASDKLRVLSELNAPAAETDRAVLEEAVADAEAEEAAAQDALLGAQYELIRVTGLPVESTLPWPADAPLVAPYRTQFETLFANRVAPLSVRRIHHSLPGKLTIVEKRMAVMAAAESTTDNMLEAYKANRAPMNQVLASIDRLHQARQSFFVAIIDYNNQIAEYSIAAVGAGLGPETLVTTLIKAPTANTALVNIPRNVRQAAAAEPSRQSVPGLR